MGKKHKLRMTRPEFMGVMTGEEGMSRESLARVCGDGAEMGYVVYTAIMDADVNFADILSAHNDGESIAITFRSRAIAERVVNSREDVVIRYGSHSYVTRMKNHGSYVIVRAELLPEPEEEKDE